MGHHWSLPQMHGQFEIRALFLHLFAFCFSDSAASSSHEVISLEFNGNGKGLFAQGHLSLLQRPGQFSLIFLFLHLFESSNTIEWPFPVSCGVMKWRPDNVNVPTTLYARHFMTILNSLLPNSTNLVRQENLSFPDASSPYSPVSF